ncbi:hypothetical protein HBO15_21325 [Pseudomonas sp. WS 5111]|jgi:hypothetical protein|uniref:hypothetical protein n=1 Tax=Pseudomonas sp. WS 5111 TaxID=2717493 RepID=UPI001473C221|nr:hypothetical protein [Pseudomonas sp. WS 5111]NMX69898.1 hypothetical protein [Pseudomonas sp. WS 5111]
MGIDDVDSDFKKARAFLLAYSTLILLLWYFSVDLRAFSFLGVPIGIRDNINNVHLVAAIGNAYFLLRFFQKAPKGSFKLNDEMITVFEETLKFIVPYAYILRLISWMRPGKDVGNMSIEYRTIDKKVTMGHQLSRNRTSILNFWYWGNSDLAQRVEISIDLGFFYVKDGRRQVGRVLGKRIIPAYALVLICQIYAFVKGSLTTSWFTDYILPIVYALAAIGVFVNTWWQVNHVL